MRTETLDTMNELRKLVQELQHSEGLQPDEAFVLWFIRSHLVESEDLSRASLTRRGNEKGVDAIYIDHAPRQVHIIQGKYRTRGVGKPEPRAEVLQLAQYGRLLTQKEDNLTSLADTADISVRERLKEARQLVRKKGYILHLYFVTTGKISGVLLRDAESTACQNGQVRFIPIHGRDIQKIIADYIFDAAPAVPTLELDVEGEILERHDGLNNIDAYVFTMNGRNVGELLKKYGRRLFARNIRGFLGKSSDVNRSIAGTLREEPHNFWYFNNGVTIICDKANECGTAGHPRLLVKNPQVINGQQTTYMLSFHGNRDAELLVRVIVIPREEPKEFGRFNDLVSEIVAATNWQNRIFPSDLKANDPEQIRIEREFRKLRILYVRKRVGKGEAKSKALAVMKPRLTIGKEELAQAIAAVDLDPFFVRSGKETLFEADIYSRLFPSGRDISEYLAAYQLHCVCKYVSRGSTLRKAGQSLAKHCLWDMLRNSMRLRTFRKKFAFASERYYQYANALNPLYRATDKLFREIRKFYYRNRKTGEGYLEERTFFKYRGRHLQFERFLRSTQRAEIQRELGKFVSLVDAVEI